MNVSKHKAYLGLLILVAIISTVFFIVPVAFAASCGGVDTAIISCGGNSNAIVEVLKIVLQILIGVVGIAAVGGIIYAGILYGTAGGNQNQAQKSKTMILNTVIGILLFGSMVLLGNFLLPGGIFGGDIPATSSTGSTANTGEGDSLVSGSESDTGDNGSTGSGPSTDTTSPTPSTTTTISLSGVKNFRDAGSTGGIKTGILFRSARLSSATSSDISKLSDLLSGGVIVDLRLASARSQFPDKIIPNTTKFNYPASSTTNFATFVTNSSDRQTFASTIKAVANAKGRILIHCTLGRDRTGWAIALILHIAGATDDQIMQDFLKTSGVPKSRLNAGLSAAESKYGSLDGYITNGLGIDSATLKTIKAKLGK